jgi:hypothetical protein
MKNVMIFQNFVNNVTYGHQWELEELFKYFRAQIDNSILRGWDINDIVICTNLPFKYKGVNIVTLEHECKFNKYFNKQFGIWELLDKKIITEPFWFHDFDDWQLNTFTFPEFVGDIGMCKYIDFTQWNTGSIFVKPSSLDIWELIIENMFLNKDNPHIHNTGDENIVNLIYQYYTKIQNRFSILDPQYNLGCTQFDKRYLNSKKPIYVGAFKPLQEKDFQLFTNKNLIDVELASIFKTHLL